jgi:hypothetical protein
MRAHYGQAAEADFAPNFASAGEFVTSPAILPIYVHFLLLAAVHLFMLLGVHNREMGNRYN